MSRSCLFSFLGGILATLAGCAAPQTTVSAPAEPPLVSPVATQAGPDLQVVVQSVTIPTSVKSWSHGASWDEYTLRFANRSEAPVVIESALLIDVRSTELAAGNQPGDLEKLSKSRWNRYLREGVPVEQYGADPTAARAAAAKKNVPAQILGWTLLCVAPPVYLGATAVVVASYASDRAGTKQEFHRRRLKLPLALAAGQELAGSFFFPVTPGPQRLVLAYRRDGELHRQEIALPDLANLHLSTRNVVARAP